jgi:hypothetical protein
LRTTNAKLTERLPVHEAMCDGAGKYIADERHEPTEGW